MKLEDPHIIDAISYFLDNDITVSNKLLEYIDKIRVEKSMNTLGKLDFVIADLDNVIRKLIKDPSSNVPAVFDYIRSLQSYLKDIKSCKELIKTSKYVRIC